MLSIHSLLSLQWYLSVVCRSWSTQSIQHFLNLLHHFMLPLSSHVNICFIVFFSRQMYGMSSVQTHFSNIVTRTCHMCNLCWITVLNKNMKCTQTLRFADTKCWGRNASFGDCVIVRTFCSVSNDLTIPSASHVTTCTTRWWRWRSGEYHQISVKRQKTYSSNVLIYNTTCVWMSVAQCPWHERIKKTARSTWRHSTSASAKIREMCWCEFCE